MRNEIRCESCGRLFASGAELREHEVECRAAKEATEEGRRQLRGETEDPNLPEEGESLTAPRLEGWSRDDEDEGTGVGGSR